MKNDTTSLVHMDANATVSRITIVCHLFCTMSILLCFELDTNPGRKGGGEGVPLTWLSEPAAAGSI